jgi:hypothetical protein
LEGHAALQRRLGPYDVADARPYQTDFIAQAAVHLPDRPPSDAWPEAEAKFMAWASAECEQACQGQHFREFRWQANYHNPHWTLLLLPVYTTYYLDDEERPYPLLIHGQTGRLSGRRQASMRRARRTTLTIAAVALALFIVSLLLAGASLLAEQLFIVAVCGVLLSILLGVLSLIPRGRVWQFNRTN